MKLFAAYLALISSFASAQTPIWSEEFDYTGAPDQEVWSYDEGNWGWGNQELQNYTTDAANVRVDGSNLVITARRSGDAFSSGRIKTLDKLTFKYGTIEARISTPDLANGLWPAFWTLGNDFPVVGWPECGEIDIMEMGINGAINDGVVNRRVGSHLHWGNLPNHPNAGSSVDMTLPINDTFVTYRMEWTPTQIRTYINNQSIWTMDTSSIPEFNAPHFFILNMAVGGDYPKIWDPNQITAPLPAEYRVDWIRIYDNGHTVLGGSSTLAPPTPGKNLLDNAGFQFGTDGWILNLSGGSAWGNRDFEHSGGYSVKIDSTGAGDWSSPNISQTFSASPGDVFHMQGWMLNPGNDPIAGGSFGLFKIEFRDNSRAALLPASVSKGSSAGPDYPGAESTPFLNASSATDTWIFSQAQAEAPAGTAMVGFYILNVNQPGNPGPMYFDDVQAALIEDIEPFNLNGVMKGSSLEMSFPTQIGYSYQVGYKTNLFDAVWIPIETIIGDGKTNSVLHPMNDPVLFYRVLVP